jgi:hypothetical protein
MSDSYVIWKYKHVRSAAVLKKITGLADVYRLKDGVPLAEELTGPVGFHMHPDFPNDLLLLDNVRNINKAVVTSRRLKEAIESRNVPDLEYLPVTIVDHKGRPANKDYFVVHQLNPVDCIDRGRSVFEMSDIVPDEIDTVEKLVLDEERIPRNRQMFRLKSFGPIVFVRRDLADALSAAQFTGLTWLDLRNYPEI